MDWKVIAGGITGIGLIVKAVHDVYMKLCSILQPLLRRQTAKIAILHNQENKDSAAGFVEELNSRGYKDVDLTAMPEALLGRQVVIVWQPKKETAAELVESVQSAVSDAFLMIFTYEDLKVQRSERVLFSNSTLRLFGDLSTLAEGLRPT
ncbi:MAG: hypothetical protein WGN25_07940 [Candidatus Electrothrix sp. GW3-4]|uniref:hypothetical protein n=1 Tax=Candidatus Electrothrix sp. GW3-4 TaxID=3126740 RepID=UPI0030D5A8C4